MELTEKTYVEHVWFLPLTPTNDFLAILYREGQGPIQLEYRFRYYLGGRIEDDDKSFYQLTFDQAESFETARLTVEEMVVQALVDKGALGPVSRVVVQGGQDHFLEVMSAQSWATVRIDPAFKETLS